VARARRTFVPGSHGLRDAAWNAAVAAIQCAAVEEAEAYLDLAGPMSEAHAASLAGLRAWIWVVANRLPEAARILDDAIASGARGEIPVTLTMQRAQVHLLIGEIEDARALLLQPEFRSAALSGREYGQIAVASMIADVRAPEGTTWADGLAERQADTASMQWTHDTAAAMAVGDVDEVVAVRDRIAAATSEATVDVRLIDLWIDRHR
jgi:hypothetical protein